MALDPLEHADLFAVIKLAGQSSPGVVTLSGHDRKAKWDVKKGPGISGGSTDLSEIPPIEFSASFYLVNMEQFEAWDTFRQLIDSTIAGAAPKALDIYHPDLADNDIKSVCKAQIGGCVHDGMGGKTYVVKFQEYRPAQPKGGSVNGSKANAKAADPNADLNAEIAALTKQYQDTPWGGEPKTYVDPFAREHQR